MGVLDLSPVILVSCGKLNFDFIVIKILEREAIKYYNTMCKRKSLRYYNCSEILYGVLKAGRWG